MESVALKEVGVVIKAFRAVDDPYNCERYIMGHERVLSSHGVEKVTSSNHEWKNNPNAYVIIVESEEGDKVLGGARVDVYSKEWGLPMIEATKDMDDNVESVVRKLGENGGTAEICGLWNSVEVAGMGIGSVYSIRCAVAILTQLNIETCWAFCSPFTARIARNYGFKIETELGNDGTFYYPKMDLLATVTVLKDIQTIETGNGYEKDIIFSLRKEPKQVSNEKSKRGQELKVDYRLKV